MAHTGSSATGGMDGPRRCRRPEERPVSVTGRDRHERPTRTGTSSWALGPCEAGAPWAGSRGKPVHSRRREHARRILNAAAGLGVPRRASPNLTHRYRPDSVGGSQAAPADLRGEYGGEVSAAGHIAAVQGTCGSRLRDRSARRGDVRYLPGELIGQSAGSLVPDGLRARTSASEPDTPGIRRPARLSGSRRYPRLYACRTPSASAVGGQASLPWRLSQSVIDSVGPASAEFARILDSARLLGDSTSAVSVHR